MAKAKELEASGLTPSFTDGSTIAKWAIGYVEIARTEQLVNGVDNGWLRAASQRDARTGQRLDFTSDELAWDAREITKMGQPISSAKSVGPFFIYKKYGR